MEFQVLVFKIKISDVQSKDERVKRENFKMELWHGVWNISVNNKKFLVDFF